MREDALPRIEGDMPQPVGATEPNLCNVSRRSSLLPPQPAGTIRNTEPRSINNKPRKNGLNSCEDHLNIVQASQRCSHSIVPVHDNSLCSRKGFIFLLFLFLDCSRFIPNSASATMHVEGQNKMRVWNWTVVLSIQNSIHCWKDNFGLKLSRRARTS